MPHTVPVLNGMILEKVHAITAKHTAVQMYRTTMKHFSLPANKSANLQLHCKHTLVGYVAFVSAIFLHNFL